MGASIRVTRQASLSRRVRQSNNTGGQSHHLGYSNTSPDIYFAASILRQGGGAVPGCAHLCRWHKRGWTYSQKPSLCDETSRAPKVDLSRACSTSLFSISSQEHQRSRFSLAILSQLHLRRLQRDVLEHLPARLLVHLGEKPTAPPWHGPRRVTLGRRGRCCSGLAVVPQPTRPWRGSLSTFPTPSRRAYPWGIGTRPVALPNIVTPPHGATPQREGAAGPVRSGLSAAKPSRADRQLITTIILGKLVQAL